MSDEDYEQAIGTEESEAAVEPGQADQGTDDDGGADSFEAGADVGAETVRRAHIPRTAASRKALADAIGKFKAEKSASDDDEGEFGDYDENDRGVPVSKNKISPAAAATGTASPQEPKTPASPTGMQPPAPSLDPEVGRLKAQLAEKLAAADQKLAEADKRRESIGEVANYETYLDSAPKAFRSWLETMRGDKMNDDEFRQEAADFVTLMSGDVLGVKLPDEVKSRIESQLTRKALSAYKTNASRKELAEANRRETERVQAEWTNAANTLDVEFKKEEVGKQYAYLAAEDSPGSIVVDVIQSAMKRDGTQLSWQEASKQANDYLKKQASAYIDKRKHLLSAAPTDKPVGGEAKAKQEARPGRPPGTQQVIRAPQAPIESPAPQDEMPVVRRHKPGSTWDKEAHRRQTRAAFAPVFKPEE